MPVSRRFRRDASQRQVATERVIILRVGNITLIPLINLKQGKFLALQVNRREAERNPARECWIPVPLPPPVRSCELRKPHGECRNFFYRQSDLRVAY